MGKIRVLVADDSVVARQFLRDFLEKDAEIEVIGEARNGKEALELTNELRPNLVTMDLEMPVMGGMEAISEIMASCAVPILVVSTETNSQKACAAMALGALDAISKPENNLNEINEFVAKVKLLARVKVITHLRTKSSDSKIEKPVSKPINLSKSQGLFQFDDNFIFAIASSTGGPQALATILGGLPIDFPCPILISQHISDGFAPGMAKWLGNISKLPIQIAENDELIRPGNVYISPSESSLIVSPSKRTSLIAHLPGAVYRPSCNALLNSVASVYGRQSIGIILSGMGKDGAEGLLKISQAGGQTLAQDEASSVVFGMNKVAIDLGGVQKILPLNEISSTMRRLAVRVNA